MIAPGPLADGWVQHGSDLSVSPHRFRYAAAERLIFETAARGWLGRMADRLGLCHLLDCRLGEVEAVWFLIYRAHHAAVAAASPLALDLFCHIGIDVDGAVSGLRPFGATPRWLAGASNVHAARAIRRGRPVTRAARDRDVEDHFLHGGLVIRPWSDEAGALGIRFSRAGLEVGARLGGVHLRTIGGVATLTTSAALPETAKRALVGQPVGDVFDHPILRERPYVIDRLVHLDPARAIDGPAWRVFFRATPVAWRPAWARVGAR